MSGGHFDYQQLWLNEIANELEQLIMRAGREIPRKEIESEWYGYYQNCYDDCIVTKNYPDYDPQTIAIMKRAVYVMRQAYIYMPSGSTGYYLVTTERTTFRKG